MKSCDICGKNEENLVSVRLEGTRMNVCSNCSNYGVKVEQQQITKKTFKHSDIPQIEEVFVPNYGQLIKNARERLGLKQEELAKKLNEKESLIHQIESGHFTPNISTIRKFEKLLDLKLINKINLDETEVEKKQKTSSEKLTIGDILEKAMNKNKK